MLATPSTALRNIAAHLAKVIGLTDAVLLSCTKGIEHGSGMRMTEILRETFPANKIAVLSGPNLATEVARDLPTASVIACRDGDCAASLQASWEAHGFGFTPASMWSRLSLAAHSKTCLPSQRELGTAIILITHDLGVIADLVDTVVVMYAGKVVERAPVKRLFAAPRHPYTQGLLRSVPSLEETREHRMRTIDGAVPSAFAMPQGCRFHPRCALARDICRAQEPPIVADDAGGEAACWALA